MRKLPDPIVLCGGAGLRLRSVIGNAPKAMASISGRPFLEVLLSQLYRYGFHRAILAVGYRREVIQAHFGESSHGLQLEYSAELSPLGTGGALRNAVNLVESDTAFIMNGDSYTDVDLYRFIDDFRRSRAEASMVVVAATGRRDCGSVVIDQAGMVESFVEKRGLAGSQYVNAGIYLVSRHLLSDVPTGIQVSLEEDLFPRWLEARNCIRAFVHRGECVDIGTPERFRGAQDVLAGATMTANVSQRGE